MYEKKLRIKMKKITGVKGLLFDYGGTLDTNGRHWAAVFFEQYQRHGIVVEKADFYNAYVYAERKMATQLIIKSSFNFKDVLFAKINAQFEYLKKETFIDTVGLQIVDACNTIVLDCLKNVQPLLTCLAIQYKMVMVSNFYGNLVHVLKDYNMLHYFETIIESSDVGVRKPNPEIYTLGIRSLGLPADACLVIGDSYTKDMEPGKVNGCKTLWLNGEGWEDEPLISTDAADYMVTDIQQLKEFLL